MKERFLLQRELEAYVAMGLYPMHMPGHKRRRCPAPGLPYGWDMTEVPGVDDLHEAEGILKEAMDRTARLYGAEKSWYLVGGSTCGLLAGIRALAPMGSTVIAARNCHKAVYHAIELGNLTVRWLMPPLVEGFGVCGSISPAAVERALLKAPEARCVILTSPTYEGVISDIAAIARVCHSHGAALLVDEAHGAHLGLFPGFPQSALQLGADLVVQSAHKTLPSLTQTALLHLGKGSLADPGEVERQLGVFETSSPSYPLLASLDGCTGILREEGAALFQDWVENLARFDELAQGLSHFRVLGHGRDKGRERPEVFAFDPGKLPVSTAGTEETGAGLAAALRERHGFETEMACGDILLGMSSPCDEGTALEAFASALLEEDSKQHQVEKEPATLLPPPGKLLLPAAEALLRPMEELPLLRAAGRTAGEYLWAYPPGIPLVAPGECLTEELLAQLGRLLESGTALHHSHCKNTAFLRVLA